MAKRGAGSCSRSGVHRANCAGRWGVALVLGMLLSGCAAGPHRRDPCGFIAGCEELRKLDRKVRAQQQKQLRQEAARQDEGGAGGEGAFGTGALTPYLEFIREREQRLKAAEPEQKQLERRVLWDLNLWALRQSEAVLLRRTPLEVYAELKSQRQEQERQEAERQAAVEARLEEYWRWAEARWEQTSRERVRRVAPRHLLTEHPLRTQSLDALTEAVLDWAFTHTRDEALLRKSPSEVALYLLARRGSLATAIELGRLAPPHLDYTPLPEKHIPPEELVLELLVGVVPVVGEATDAGGLLVGYSITGRELDANERLLCGVGSLVPFVPGRALSSGGELVERAALLTGRSVEEVQVLQRVARHLSPADAAQVETLVRQAARGRQLTAQEIAFLKRLAAQLEAPLLAAADTLRRGGKVPLVGSRLGEAGLRLEPGSAEHMAAAWVDYQFRHPGKYPRFRYGFDADWRRQYELILKNKEAGGEFEQAVLKARGQPKNTAMMMPPPGSAAQGFIPDSVPGSPTPGELIWGQPYHFVEVKGRKDLALGGNLKAMLEYVERYGGYIELWVRSPKHPGGATKLSGPLKRRIADLEKGGKAAVKNFP
jgi:hypothetical protein